MKILFHIISSQKYTNVILTASDKFTIFLHLILPKNRIEILVI